MSNCWIRIFVGSLLGVALTIGTAYGNSILIKPSAPIEGQPITISVSIIDGSNYPHSIASQSYSISGNAIHLGLCQDGSSWLPNPPFDVTWYVGPLTRGTYTVQFVSQCAGGAVFSTATTTFVVGPCGSASETGHGSLVWSPASPDSGQPIRITAGRELYTVSSVSALVQGNVINLTQTGQFVGGGTTPPETGCAVETVGPLPASQYTVNYFFNDVATPSAPPTLVQSSSLTVSPAANYQGLWWDAAESGWGVNFAHEGDQVFATWYTYDTSGNPWWLSILATRIDPAAILYAGPIYASSGPSFDNFVGAGSATQVGNGSVRFSDANTASFNYRITTTGAGTVDQTKAITRFNMGGTQPVCTYSANPDLNGATNYQGLWWAPAEPGWGVNFAHQDAQVFATWFTYAADNSPMWLSAKLARQGTTNVYSGPLIRSSGSRFDRFDSFYLRPSVIIGGASVTFADGNHATFNYVTADSRLPVVNQTKAISRFVFAAPAGTVCH